MTEVSPSGAADSTSTVPALRGSFEVSLTAILVVAGLLRLGVLLVRASKTNRFLTPDSAGYLTLSRDLAAFGSKSNNARFSLSLYRTPVYPLYLAIARDVTHSSIVGPMLLQVLVAVGVVYLTYRLGISLFGRPVALWAAAILAVDPLSIIYSSLVLTETLFAFFLLCSILLLWRPKDNRWTRGFCSGLLLGVATLTRPLSLYLSIVLAVGYLILERQCLRSAVMVALSFLIGFGLVTGGWIIRNDLTGGVATISTVEGYNGLHYRAVGALEEGQGLSPAQADANVSNQLRAKLPPNPTPGQVDKEEESLAKTIILNNPIGYTKEFARGGARMMLGEGGAEFTAATADHATDVVDAFGDLYLVVLYLLVVLGLWSAWREHRSRNCVVPLIVILYVVVASSGLDAYSRMRL